MSHGCHRRCIKHLLYHVHNLLIHLPPLNFSEGKKNFFFLYHFNFALLFIFSYVYIKVVRICVLRTRTNPNTNILYEGVFLLFFFPRYQSNCKMYIIYISTFTFLLFLNRWRFSHIYTLTEFQILRNEKKSVA